MTNTDGNQASLGELRYWIRELIEELEIRPSTQQDDFGAAWALAEKVEHQRLALGFPEMANVCPCDHGYWVDTSDPVFGIKLMLGFGYIARADLHNRDKLRKNLEAWLRYFDKTLARADPSTYHNHGESAPTPRWARDTGELYFGSTLVKEIRVANAKNVSLVLDSFQELGWPTRIDDPLTQGGVNDPAR